MKKFLLLASAMLVIPFFSSLAFAQDNGSRAYLNVGDTSNQVGAFAGPIKNSKGVVLGNISPSGDITDAAQDNLGKINIKGQVTDPQGKLLGVVAPADKFSAYNLAKKASLSH